MGGPLYHLTPENRNSPHHPIILAHGLGTNRFNLAPIMEVSFTEYLRARGHDVWAIELRGPDGPATRYGSLSRTPNYDFTDYVKYDLPASSMAWLSEPSQHNFIGSATAWEAGWATQPRCSTGARRFTSLTAIASPAVTANQFCASKRLSAPPATEGTALCTRSLGRPGG